VTITVVSNAEGRYSFPRTKLEPGRYSLRIRAVGYELDGSAPVEVKGQETTQLDLKLRKARDLAYQLSNGEWVLSMPGTAEQKRVFTNQLGCVGCHSLERVVRSRYNATEFKQVLMRMRSYAAGSSVLHPQKLPPGWVAEPSKALQEQMAKQAEYLSTINLSTSSTWEYPLKTLPRPRGKGTRVIITEYDLPRPETMPHDVIVDSEGRVWYGDFGSQFLGKLDPKTGKTVEYPIPDLKPGYPLGSLDVQFDRDGNIWLGLKEQEGIGKFDRKTEKFQTWRFPKNVNERLNMVMPLFHHLDGKVWVGGNTEYRADIRSGQWEEIDYARDIPKDSPAANLSLSAYGVVADSQNNFYGLNMGGGYIVKVDAKTMKVTPYKTPTPDSGPRRGHMDLQDRLWFAEYHGNGVGMFDTKSQRFQEWIVPSPWTNPYDAIVDKNGEVWTGGMMNDHVARLNAKTGELTEYLLPRTTNIRRVDVDNSTTPVTFWVGGNLGASIVKLEPLD
ncbi:MAG: hypothetical protein HY315_06120, partial [Acidobacteria bacterium]|nr:hypothetical protein [Acidobacteriota bacterium]